MPKPRSKRPSISKIPYGLYCYDSYGRCPYWSIDRNRTKQANGYCAYLRKGDWDFNASTKKTITDQHGRKLSPSQMPFGIGLLWDQCKECGVRMDDRKQLCK